MMLAANPDIKLVISGGGSGNGIKALGEKQCDVAMSSRDIKDKERAAAEKKGVKPVRIAVAVDAIVPVVNPENPVKDLSLDQLAAIYSGKVRNWKELEEALAEGCDRIMFDNFTPEDTKRAVELVAGRCETESSGGITFETMIPYAKAGVDFISFGALTHSVKGLDMSFKAAGSDKLIIS